MKRSDFYYELPERLIAQTPAEKRGQTARFLFEAGDGAFILRLERKR